MTPERRAVLIAAFELCARYWRGKAEAAAASQAGCLADAYADRAAEAMRHAEELRNGS